MADTARPGAAAAVAEPLMPETADEALVRKAKAVAWALGITVYIRDGGVYQREPGIAVEPPPGAQPETAGRGPISEGVSE